MSYTDHKVMQEEQAQAWLEANADSLKDVACPEQGYGERKGYEVFNGVMLEIAEEELSEGYWAESLNDQTLLEDAGIFNVATLKCWNGKQEHDDTGKAIGTKFVPSAHIRKDKLASKDRARFGIEFCYDKAGRVRSPKRFTGETLKAAVTEVKVTRVAKRLGKLARLAAAADARKAREAS